MSQMAPEAPPAAVRPSADGSRGSNNPLKRKIGPLPTWVWVLIVAGVIIAWAFWKSRTSGSAGAGTSAADTGDTTDASQVPQFVNQTFTSVSPPAAPNPVPGPAPVIVPGQPMKTAGTPGGVGVKTLTVTKPMTLRQFAKEHNWTPTTLRVVEEMNHLKASSRLRKGQKIRRPWAPEQPGQPPL